MGANHLELLSNDQELGPVAGRLWRAARALANEGDYTARPISALHFCGGWNARQLAAAVSAGPATTSDLGDSSKQPESDLGLTERDCDSLGLRAQV